MQGPPEGGRKGSGQTVVLTRSFARVSERYQLNRTWELALNCQAAVFPQVSAGTSAHGETVITGALAHRIRALFTVGRLVRAP